MKVRVSHNVHSFIILFLCFLVIPFKAFADCSCLSTNSITFLGPEYMATSFSENPCPDSGDQITDADLIKYTYYQIGSTECLGNEVQESSSNFSWSYFDFTPQAVIDANLGGSYGFRAIRNPSGTHILFISKYFQGTIAGQSLAYNGPTVVYTSGDDAFEDYCSADKSFTPPDYDGDGQDCLSCLPDTANYQGVCAGEPPCKNCGPGCVNPSY